MELIRLLQCELKLIRTQMYTNNFCFGNNNNYFVLYIWYHCIIYGSVVIFVLTIKLFLLVNTIMVTRYFQKIGTLWIIVRRVAITSTLNIWRMLTSHCTYRVVMLRISGPHPSRVYQRRGCPARLLLNDFGRPVTMTVWTGSLAELTRILISRPVIEGYPSLLGNFK